MEFVMGLIDFVLHIDKHLKIIMDQYGVWTYMILFLIVFCETGLVVTPFLPGDSLMFVVGALGKSGALDVKLAALMLVIAAIIGDTVNYHIGKFIGQKAYTIRDGRFLKKKHLEKTASFYERHGGKTIIVARFIPIIRTFAPFVAGVGSMAYLKFIGYNIVGAILWVLLFVSAGYFFGSIPLVENNFTLVIIAIIVISVMPGIVTFVKGKLNRESEEKTKFGILPSEKP